jgi:hypothetical protein
MPRDFVTKKIQIVTTHTRVRNCTNKQTKNYLTANKQRLDAAFFLSPSDKMN